jgi:hypothetical protein
MLGSAEVVATYDFAGADDFFGDVAAVTDRSGVVTTAWFGKTTGFRVAQRRSSGTWETPVAITSCVEPECFAFTPALAADGNGTVTALWSQESRLASQRGTYVSSRSRGGPWTTPVRLSSGPCGNGSLAANSAGAVLVAFGCAPGRVITIYRSPGSSWTDVHRHVFRHTALPHTAISDHGTALLVAARNGNASRLVAHRLGRSDWSAGKTLGSAGPYGWFTVAMGPGGRAAVVWTYPLHQPRVRARVMSPRGLWHPTVSLSHRGALVDAVNTYMPVEPLVVVNRKVTVAWSTRRDAIRTATRTRSGQWSAVTAYRRGSGFLLDLTANRSGSLSMLWGRWRRWSAALYAGVYQRTLGWSARVKVPGRWMGDAPPPDAVSVTLPTGSTLVVNTTTDAPPGLDPPMPGTMNVVARTVTP